MFKMIITYLKPKILTRNDDQKYTLTNLRFDFRYVLVIKFLQYIKRKYDRPWTILEYCFTCSFQIHYGHSPVVLMNSMYMRNNKQVPGKWNWAIGEHFPVSKCLAIRRSAKNTDRFSWPNLETQILITLPSNLYSSKQLDCKTRAV